MSTSDIIAIVSAAIAALGLGLAALQHFGARRKARTDAERLVIQQERMRTAVTAAVAASELADLMVQRAKEKGATVAELQSLARSQRQTLSLLASQLKDEDKQILQWRGQLLGSQAARRGAGA